jgi:energy-coupling factor transporter ATP-binding protein EcfA2
MSGGQRRRLNLSVTLGFAYLMIMNCACPSAIFLDEVASNLDRPGIEGVCRMIRELSHERQVFVITHDVELLEMLSGCDVIELVMKDGITHLV